MSDIAGPLIAGSASLLALGLGWLLSARARRTDVASKLVDMAHHHTEDVTEDRDYWRDRAVTAERELAAERARRRVAERRLSQCSQPDPD